MSTFDPLVGQVLDDRYEILAKLARGGMATVYRARDLRLTRVVAVKIMRSDLGEDDEFAAKFDHEARAAAILNHPAVVGVFDQGICRGQPYIVMEFVDGETLRRLISREGPLPPKQALELLEPVISALANAHEHGLVHRDIKPENILISTRGQVKVADFGLARLMSAPQMTATGVLVGTASYLPPELVTHSRPDSRSDVYSTGVVLFEMLTGKKPHTGENNYQIAYKHVNVDIEPPSQRLEALGRGGWPVPDYVDALVLATTARSPDRRIGDARELLERVREVRSRLARSPRRNDPELTVKLWPQSDFDSDDTVHISPAGMPRPRPRSTPSPATGVTPVISAPVSLSRPRPRPSPADMWQPVGATTATAVKVRQETAIAHRSEDSLRERMPRVVRTPVFPALSISQDPVHRRRRGIMWVVLLLLVTIGVGLGSWWWAEGRFTTVPAVVLTGSAEVEASAGARDLRVSVLEEYSETVQSGLVIRSDPAAGTRVLRGETLTVHMSLGPERYLMPAIVGRTLDAASASLVANNLEVGELARVWSETVDDGVVLEASYDPEASLPPGTAVDLVVSKGREPIAVVDFTGRSAATATGELEAAGLEVTATQEHSAEVAAGLVITQTPSSGTAHRGQVVELVTSLGPVMVEVPDVRYQRVEEATKTLEDAGLVVETRYITELPLALGIASGTEPGRGSSVPEGSTVVVLVA